jgi:hypothetical protein
MKNKNIITIVLLIILIFWFLISRNENFMYEFNKIKSWIFISLLYKVAPDPEYKFPEYTSEQLDEMFEWVESYTWELPPIPDKKLNDSTLLWIDSNNNWVRDDLEIWIVENFWRDKVVVEGYFSYIRSKALNIKIQQEWIFTDELYENDISRRVSLANECKSDYYNASKYPNSNSEWYLTSRSLEKLRNDTTIRQKNATDFYKNLVGHTYTARNISIQECNDFIEETKTYKIY